MERAWIVFCLAVLLAASASAKPGDLKISAGLDRAQKPSEKGEKAVMDEILKVEDSAMEEWRKGNPMRWIEISAADIIYIDPGLTAPIVGIKAYIPYLEPLKGKIFYDASEYVNPRVALYGKTAVLTYNYHSLNKKPDGQYERTSFWNTTEVYRLIGDEWKIVHSHWSHIKGWRKDGGV